MREIGKRKAGQKTGNELEGRRGPVRRAGVGKRKRNSVVRESVKLMLVVGRLDSWSCEKQRSRWSGTSALESTDTDTSAATSHLAMYLKGTDGKEVRGPEPDGEKWARQGAHTYTHVPQSHTQSAQTIRPIQPRHQPPALPSRRGPSILSAHPLRYAAAWVTGTRSQRRTN